MPRPRLVVDYVERVLVACMNIIYSASRENRDAWSANGTFGTYYTMIRTSGLGLVGDARDIPVCNRPQNARLFMGRGSYMDKMLYVLRRMGLSSERMLLSPWLVPG